MATTVFQAGNEKESYILQTHGKMAELGSDAWGVANKTGIM